MSMIICFSSSFQSVDYATATAMKRTRMHITACILSKLSNETTHRFESNLRHIIKIPIRSF